MFTFKTKLKKKWYPADVIQLFFTANSLFRGLNKYQNIFFLLPETHLYVVYDIYVTYPTTPYEIVKNLFNSFI